MTEPTGPDPFAVLDKPASVAPTVPGSDPFASLGPIPPSYEEPKQPRAAYKGTLLPFSRDDQGNVSFDPLNAGPIGALKQAFTLPGRVKSGEVQVDPSNPAFIGETLNFAGAVNPVNPAVRSGDFAWAGMRRTPVDPRSVKTPSWQELKTVGGKQIDDYQKAPINYNPQYMPTLATQIEQELLKDGVIEKSSPILHSILAEMRANVGKPGDTPIIEPGNLIAIRKAIVDQFDKPGESQRGAGIALRHLDNFIANPPKGSVLARPAAAAGAPSGGPARIGDAFAALEAERVAYRDAAEAGALYARGRGNFAAGSRGEELEQIQRAARLRGGAAHSGLNEDNTIRGRVASHVLNDQKVKGYTPGEVAMLEAIPEGTLGRNLMRGAGKILGGGGGLGATVAGTTAYGAGHMFGLGGPASTAFGFAAPALGQVLQRAAGRGTREALDEASRVLRQRSPAFQEQGWRYGVANDPGRDAMARTLIRMGTQGTGAGVPVEQPVLEPTAEELQARGVPRITVTPYM